MSWRPREDGGILVSSTVHDLVVGSGIEFAERGTHELKGVPGSWTLYEVTAALTEPVEQGAESAATPGANPGAEPKGAAQDAHARTRDRRDRGRRSGTQRQSPRPEAGQASSYREAPLIAEDPSADTTDVYAFRSLDAPNSLTVIANWIPAEDPAAGPNWYRFSQRARYAINIDRSGDGKADVTYRFRFKNREDTLFLGNTVQDYAVTRVARGNETVVARGVTPPNNIGPRTTPNYRQLANAAVTNLAGGGKVFAGQREDAFFADIGAIFDLVAIRKGTGNMGGGKDFFANYATHGIALQIRSRSSTTPTTRSASGRRRSGLA